MSSEPNASSKPQESRSEPGMSEPNKAPDTCIVELKAFQGAVIVNLDSASRTSAIIAKVINSKEPLNPRRVLGCPCYDLKLSNKYYNTTINVFDYDQLCQKLQTNGTHQPSTADTSNAQLFENKTLSILSRTEAIIIHADGSKVTSDQLDASINQLKAVGGEPRILLYHSIDEECTPYRGLQSWCIENNFDFINSDSEGIDEELLNSLSAYKWSKLNLVEQPNQQQRHTANHNTSSPVTNNHNNNTNSGTREEFMQQIQDFDQLLKDINSYQDKPEEDKLTSIATKLSMLLGEQ